MSLKLVATLIAGSGSIALPIITGTFINSAENNLFFSELKNKNTIEVSKERLKNGNCKVLANDLNNKNQIVVCPTPSLIFGFIEPQTKKLQKIEKFGSSVRTEEHRAGKWNLEYNFQFWLSERTGRTGAQTIRISEEENNSLSQLNEISLSSCTLSENKLSCKKQQGSGYSIFITLDLVKNQEYLVN